MKALPKPTMMMLWIARFYSIWVLGFGLVRLISYSNEPDSTVVVGSAPKVGMTAGITTVVTHHGPTLSLIFNVFFSACLVCGLLMLYQKLGRILVGTSAVCIFSMTIFGIFHLLYLLVIANSVSTSFLHIKIPVIFVLSFCNVAWQLLNIWLALQPPDHANKIGGGNQPPFASPQSL